MDSNTDSLQSRPEALATVPMRYKLSLVLKCGTVNIYTLFPPLLITYRSFNFKQTSKR